MSVTTSAAQAIQTEIQRKMTGEQCLMLALEMSDFASEFAAQRIRDEHPDWSPGLLIKELMRISLRPARLR
jgi:hypothetical protein